MITMNELTVMLNALLRGSDLSEEQVQKLYEGEAYRPCDDYFIATITKDGEDILTYVGDVDDNRQEMYEDLEVDRTYRSHAGYFYHKFLSDAYFLEQVATDYNIALERINTAILVDKFLKEANDGESTGKYPNNQQDNSDT